MRETASSFIAECFWPGVTEAEVAALDRRAATSARQLDDAAEPVRYLGSILMRDDEVLLCQFEGAAAAVRRAAELAEIPFERIVEIAHTPRTS